MDSFSKTSLFCCTFFLLLFTLSACGTSGKSPPGTKQSESAPVAPLVEEAPEAELSVGASRSALDKAIAQGSPTLLKAAQETDADPDFCLGETVFIGDSRTNGLITYTVLPPEQVYAINGSNQASIQDRQFIQLDESGRKLSVTEAVAIRRPHQILLAFGINAIPVMQEEEFLLEYKQLIDSLLLASPDSKIILQSILPVAWWKYQEVPSFENKRIDYYNTLLYQFAEDYGYSYLDLSRFFKDSQNSLHPDYDGGDGLHFTVSAYDRLIEYYRGYLLF